MSSLNGFIDLHSHTNESDGTLSPADLVLLAKQLELDALAITDHDTFSGYELALPVAKDLELDLVRGIELSTRLNLADGSHRFLHLLAYFPDEQLLPSFAIQLAAEQEDRRDRNRRLVESLQSRHINITLDEIQARGRSLAGRPHFARILMEKGYVSTYEEAFERYIGESAPSYVERQSKTTEEAIRSVRGGGGIPVVAHPVRLSLSPDTERATIRRLREAGLLGIEVFHSEHPPNLQAYYQQMAKDLELLSTGGSDFHGKVKPNVLLGSGVNGNVQVPSYLLEQLRGTRVK